MIEKGGGLPAIEVYRLGNGYYVVDGHHRVAAAQRPGILDIDAVVIEYVAMGTVQSAKRTKSEFTWFAPVR